MTSETLNMKKNYYRGDIIRTQDGLLGEIFRDVDDGFTVFFQNSTAKLNSNDEFTTTVDRILDVGDTVWHNPSSEFGVVRSVRKLFDLQTVQGEILTEISSEKIDETTDLGILDIVIFDNWVGCVDERYFSLNVISADDDSVYCIRPINGINYFRPGQVINLDQMKFEIKRQWPSSKAPGGTVTVSNVMIEQVRVNWIANVRGLEPRPSSLQRPNQLVPIRFAERLPSLHDWVFYPRVDLDTSKFAEIIDDYDWACAVRSAFRESLLVVRTRTFATLLSESGSEWESLEAVELIPEEGFSGWITGKFVLSKATGHSGFIKRLNSKERLADVKWFGEGDQENVSLYDIDLHPQYNFSYDSMVFRIADMSSLQSMIGTVISLVDGLIRVKWADGEISSVGPDDIYVVEPVYQGSEESDTENCDSDSIKHSEVEDDVASEEATALELTAEEPLSHFDIAKCPTDHAMYGLGLKEVTALELTAEEPLSHFDIAKCPTDHAMYGLGLKNISRKFHNAIQKEWKLLKGTLPEGIYVRVYEDQVDLMRGMIVGVEGTPYHNGLFFFDILLPPDYPDSIPRVKTMRLPTQKLNPNFLPKGEICLSLLGTVRAKNNEAVWTSDSSICQLLISLQALVLNAKPFFNEEGFGVMKGTIPGERASTLYNEDAYVTVCKIICGIIREPPEDYKDVVDHHFRKVGSAILRNCQARIVDDSASGGFKTTLKRLILDLSQALKDLGANLEQHESQ